MHRTEAYRLYLSDGWSIILDERSIILDESFRTGIVLSLLLTATGAVQQGILIALVLMLCLLSLLFIIRERRTPNVLFKIAKILGMLLAV